METLELEKKKAVEAYENGSKKERSFLERLYGKKTFQKDVKARIKTLEDVLNELGKSDADVMEYRKLQRADVSGYILGNQEAVLIAKALNEGWQPDFENSSEYKYFPWFKMGSSGFRYFDYAVWFTCSAVGSRLCFKSSELAKYSGEQFTEIHKKYMITK